MAEPPTGKDASEQPEANGPGQEPEADPAPAAGGEGDDASVDAALEAASASLEQIKADVDATAGPQNPAAPDAAESDAGDAPRGAPGDAAATSLELLGDVELDVMIELGRTEMLVEDVLKLQNGSVVELDKLAGDPVDVYVNGRLVARGEVLVLNDNFCIRISEVLADLEQEAEAVAEAHQAQG